MEKSKNLQEQLKELKSEIEVLKVEENQTEMDRIHEENAQQGETKYITLRKVIILIEIENVSLVVLFRNVQYLRGVFIF